MGKSPIGGANDTLTAPSAWIEAYPVAVWVASSVLIVPAANSV